MKLIQTSLALFLLPLSSLIQAAPEWQAPLLQDHPLVGQIYDINNQQPISEQELISRLQKTALVLIGEKHDNQDHHQLEARLVKALTSGDTKPAVVFEMLNLPQQPQLDKLSAQDSLSSMKAQLKWNPKSWDWSDYGPLFQLTRQQMAPLIAGNISREKIRAIYKKQDGALNEARFNTLSEISQPVREQIHDEIYRNHCELMPRERLSPMVDIQLARDASMATAMLQNRTDSGAVLIAGGFHVRKDLSVPLHLNLLATDKSDQNSQAVLLLAEVEEGKQQLADYSSSQHADYLWLTPKQHNRDYCAEMREKMQQKAVSKG